MWRFFHNRIQWQPKLIRFYIVLEVALIHIEWCVFVFSERGDHLLPC